MIRVLIILCLVLPAFAQVGLRSPAFVAQLQRPAAAASCTLYAEQALTASSASPASAPLAQKIKNTSGTDKEVCKVRIHWAYRDGMQCKIQIRTAANGGGSQFGSDSITVANAAGGSAGYTEYTWASNPTVTAATDFFINLVYVSTNNGDQVSYWDDGAGNGYEDATYQFWTGATQQNFQDMTFEVFFQ